MKYWAIKIILILLCCRVAAQDEFALKLSNAAIDLTRQPVTMIQNITNINIPTATYRQIKVFVLM